MSKMSDIQDSDELVRFRQAWKAEVKNRLAQTQSAAGKKKTTEERGRQEGVPVSVTLENAHDAQPRPSAGPSYARAHHSGDSVTTSKSLASAVETYRLAVQYEQEGDLDSALVHYKHAFRLDSHVDKAYRKEELRVAALGGGETSHTRKKSVDEGTVDGIREGLQKVAFDAPSKSAAVAGHDTLAALVAAFPSDLRYEPEDERHPVRLNMLPNEIMAHALHYLDATSIERFASVCRKARLVSLDSGVWV
jgi:F-box protein 9